MDDLRYIVSLGFSGTDVWSAAVIGFFAAMLVSKKAGLWAMAGVALLVDRMIWPLVAQALHGASTQTIYASVAATFEMLIPNAGFLIVRYLGLVMLIALFVALRKRLHGPQSAPAKGGKPAAA